MESREIWLGNRELRLEGRIARPPGARGLVIFAHGSGSNRFSPRNESTAAYLYRKGLATLLFDLLTREESANAGNVFDIPLLASRLLLAVRWVRAREALADLPYGFFGASTGAGAALWAASELADVAAIVSRGGRADLAGPRLHLVRAPTLLLVGENDGIVLALNRQVLGGLRSAELTVVPRAGHLFEEPGALEMVEQESSAWFLNHFPGRAREVA